MENIKNPFKKREENHEENNIEQEETTNSAEQETTEQEETTQESIEQVNEFEEKYNDLNNKYLRLAADFDNYRKRTQNEKEELSKYTTAKVLEQIVNAIDTFDRADEHLKDSEDCAAIKEGYNVAVKQLKDILSKIGLVEIDALGKAFDPNEHEAITQIQTEEYEPDTIAYVARKGYKIEDKIVRTALVGVAKAKEEE